MKLMMVVVQKKDATRFLSALVQHGLRATRLASTGGFLREGNTTFMIGAAEDDVDTVLETVRSTCRAREQLVAPLAPVAGPDAFVPYPVEIVVGGATVFVLTVDRFEKV